MYAHKREKKPRQMSESLLVGLLLAFSGGLMDAYTYVLRDHVFANAQTGNIILFAISLFEGSAPAAVRYLLPILSFMLGVLSAQGVRLRFAQAVATLEAVSPLAVLARGYAVATRGKRGAVVTDAAALEAGDTLHIRFAKGAANCRVTDTEEEA